MANTMGFPYDYSSIMHYDSYAFSKNGQPTMLAKQPNVKLIDNHLLSPIDAAEVNTLYKNCTLD